MIQAPSAILCLYELMGVRIFHMLSYHPKMQCLLPFLFLVQPLFFLSIQSIQIELTHINQHSNMTESDVIRHMIQRSRSRLTSLLSKLAHSNSPASASKAQMQIQYGNYEYLMELSIGTPRLRYLAILDTGSDLIWTQCQPCIMCFGQPTPLFDPSHSSTYRQLTCSDMLCKKLYGFHGSSNRCMTCRYTYAYAGDAYTKGILSSESFIIGDSFLANLSFGCGDTYHGDVLSQAAGIVGLGRGSFSLTTQLGIDKFSYCLASPLTKFKSILKLGPEDQFADHTKARVITLAPNPYNEKIFYHITLKGIRVGNTSIAVANHMLVVPSNSNNTGGMIVDSGTAITYLEQAVFDMVLAAFVRQMDLPIGDGSGLGLDLCFMLPGSENIDTVYIPDMVFQFEGDDLELDRANYFGVEKSTSQMCLMMAASNGLSILGNFQQQNMEVLYDLKAEKISFLRTNCGEKGNQIFHR